MWAAEVLDSWGACINLRVHTKGVMHPHATLRRVLRRLFTLRAEGALISEPRFSTPCDMRFFPCDTGKTAIFKEKPLKMAILPLSHGKNRMSQGVENRGSLISAPSALRVTASAS